MYIVIVGNVVDGLNFYGPFIDKSNAIDWADMYMSDDWTVVELENV